MTLDILGNANGIIFKDLKHKGTRQGCHCIESRDIGAYDTCMNKYSVNPYVGCTHACKDRRYWIELDKEIKAFAAKIGFDYVTNDDQLSRDFNAPPVIVNYFYHEQIKKSARKGAMRPGDACSAPTGAERRGESHAGIAGS